MLIRLVTFIFLSLLPAVAEQLTDNQITQAIIWQSRQSYYTTGHPCACPYDRAKNGSLCGGRSAYRRPGGAAPFCYAKDVTQEMITNYRKNSTAE